MSTFVWVAAVLVSAIPGVQRLHPRIVLLDTTAVETSRVVYSRSSLPVLTIAARESIGVTRRERRARLVEIIRQIPDISVYRLDRVPRPMTYEAWSNPPAPLGGHRVRSKVRPPNPRWRHELEELLAREDSYDNGMARDRCECLLPRPPGPDVGVCFGAGTGRIIVWLFMAAQYLEIEHGEDPVVSGTFNCESAGFVRLAQAAFPDDLELRRLRPDESHCVKAR